MMTGLFKTRFDGLHVDVRIAGWAMMFCLRLFT